MLHQDDYFQPFTALSVHPLVPIVLVIQEWKAPPLLSIWPHLFRGAGHEKRRGEQLKWSLAFRLYIGSFPCAQQSSYSPVGPSVFCVFSLFICVSFICLCVPILLCFPGQLSHLPYSFWRWRNKFK